MTCHELYTSLDDALKELKRRRQNPLLTKKVTQFLRNTSSSLPATPAAILIRPLATPNFETGRFLQIAAQTELFPVFLEMPEDRFVSFNPIKYALGKMTFHWKNHQRCLRVVDFHRDDGKRLSDISLQGGMRLIDFHRELIFKSMPIRNWMIDNISQWHSQWSANPPHYLHFLALAITSGILFENFLVNESEEKRLTLTKVVPSFLEAVKLFGERPLIVRLFGPEEEHDLSWSHYPGEVYSFARDLKRTLNPAFLNPNFHAGFPL
jgi:hypothetical protein